MRFEIVIAGYRAAWLTVRATVVLQGKCPSHCRGGEGGGAQCECSTLEMAVVWSLDCRPHRCIESAYRVSIVMKI